VEILLNARIKAILGESQIEGVQIFNTKAKDLNALPVEGVLVHVGWEPQSEYLKGILPLDKQGHVLVDQDM